VMILGFAWIEVFKKVMGFSGFGVLKYSGIVAGSAIGLELIQILVPWRAFNPVDMVYNLVGAVVGVLFVVVSKREKRGTQI